MFHIRFSEYARDPDLIPDGFRDFNLYPGKDVCLLYILSCVVSGDSPDILLTTDSERPSFTYLSSVLFRSLLPVQASDTRAFGL